MTTRGKKETKEVEKFVDMLNKFFDCLNVSNFTAGMHSRNPFKSPYRKKTDFSECMSECALYCVPHS